MLLRLWAAIQPELSGRDSIMMESGREEAPKAEKVRGQKGHFPNFVGVHFLQGALMVHIIKIATNTYFTKKLIGTCRFESFTIFSLNIYSV